MGDLMRISKRTQTEAVGERWNDVDGFVFRNPPGTGARMEPEGIFPTGPEVGETLPNIRLNASTGDEVDLNADRKGRPAVVVFYRSAVW